MDGSNGVMLRNRKMMQAILILCPNLEKMRCLPTSTMEDNFLTAQELDLLLSSAAKNSPSTSCWPKVIFLLLFFSMVHNLH